MIDVNGSPATSAPAGISGLVPPPGQNSQGGGLTSVPVFGNIAGTTGKDFAVALGDPDFSSRTFALPPGTDTIAGTYIGGLDFGNNGPDCRGEVGATAAGVGAGNAGDAGGRGCRDRPGPPSRAPRIGLIARFGAATGRIDKSSSLVGPRNPQCLSVSDGGEKAHPFPFILAAWGCLVVVY